MEWKARDIGNTITITARFAIGHGGAEYVIYPHGSRFRAVANGWDEFIGTLKACKEWCEAQNEKWSAKK